MFKKLIFVLAVLSQSALAQTYQYSSITEHKPTGDRSGFSVNTLNNTFLMCEGGCRLFKMNNVRFYENKISFIVFYSPQFNVPYTITVDSKKIIMRAYNGAVPGYPDAVMYVCNAKKPAPTQCYNHDVYRSGSGF